jgi:hypothetical protein
MWSCGFGTEIGTALLGLSFERLAAKSVWCKIMRANSAPPSWRCIGMAHEKRVAALPWVTTLKTSISLL